MGTKVLTSVFELFFEVSLIGAKMGSIIHSNFCFFLLLGGYFTKINYFPSTPYSYHQLQAFIVTPPPPRPRLRLVTKLTIQPSASHTTHKALFCTRILMMREADICRYRTIRQCIHAENHSVFEIFLKLNYLLIKNCLTVQGNIYRLQQPSKIFEISNILTDMKLNL